MIDWDRAVVLSTTEADVLRELAGFEHLPAALQIPSPGRTHPERDRIVRDTVRDLRERGLVHGVRPVPDILRDLTTLIGADEVRDLVVTAPVRHTAVAATAGNGCVIAVRLDSRLALARVPAADASAELVGLAGAVRPGPGHVVRVPAAVLAGALAAGGSDVERFSAELMRRGVDGRDVTALLRMSELIGAGQLGAGRRTNGRLHRADHPLLLHVTELGCYRQRRLRRTGADPLVEAGPVDGAALTRELDELLAGAG